jgi:hypothetical protein
VQCNHVNTACFLTTFLTRWALATAPPPVPTNLTASGVYSVVVGSPCRVESDTSYMYCPEGASQNDTAEQFALFPAATNSVNAGDPLRPGSSIFIKSLQTDKFCRVVTTADGKQQILCDVDDPYDPAAGASTMTFTGTGFSYQGQGFSNFGSDEPLQLDPQGMLGGFKPGAPST